MERFVMVLWLISVVHSLRCIYAFSQEDAISEGDVLYKFKLKLEDPKNIIGNMEVGNEGHCKWGYITCNVDNSVTGINLVNHNLKGQLATELAQLKSLMFLNLWGNDINGTIPSEFGNLANLIGLYLYHNSLTGPIPNTLGKLSNLKFLYLDNNRLNGSIPMTLTSIKPLSSVNVSNNLLVGLVPNNGSFWPFGADRFANNDGLCGPVLPKKCH